MQEFLVVATVKEGGAAYPPFIVEAEDESAAVRISQRRWLRIDRVVPYQGQQGDQKPPILQRGPPASDRTFERDYHNRPPAPDQSKEKKAPSPAGRSRQRVVEPADQVTGRHGGHLRLDIWQSAGKRIFVVWWRGARCFFPFRLDLMSRRETIRLSTTGLMRRPESLIRE